MNQQHAVGLQLLHHGERCRRAVGELIEALPGASVGAVDDDLRTFEVEVAARSQEEALHVVWNAIAEAGCDDHVAFAEHPDIPQHWRAREDWPPAAA
jgi:hypothetical protein